MKPLKKYHLSRYMEKESKTQPRFSKIVSGANDASLGISVVVAVLLGIGVGIVLENLSGLNWLFWLGVAWGIGAAVLNLYKAYKRMLKDAEELAKNPRYAYKKDKSDE